MSSPFQLTNISCISTSQMCPLKSYVPPTMVAVVLILKDRGTYPHQPLLKFDFVSLMPNICIPTQIDTLKYWIQGSYERHYTLFYINVFRITLFRHYSENWKFDINVLSIWENHLSNTHIFVILPVLFLFSHILNASEQLQLLIYALLSLKCRELHLRVF